MNEIIFLCYLTLLIIPSISCFIIFINVWLLKIRHVFFVKKFTSDLRVVLFENMSVVYFKASCNVMKIYSW